MMKFSTLAERMQHQYAKLIPNTVWTSPGLFKEEIDLSILGLMSTDSASLINYLNTHRIPQLPNIKRYQAWLVIALSNSNLNDADLFNIARHLRLTNDELFYLACVWGNQSFFHHLCQQYPSEQELRTALENNRRPLFTIAAEHGHLHLIKFLVTLSPSKVEEMLEAHEYDAFFFSLQE